MKRLPIIIAFMMLSLLSFAQLEIDYNYLNQQQKEIGSIIKADVEAQARQNMLKAQQNQTQLGQGQTQTRQGQTSQQQAIQDFNNRISIEGQQRMEYYNNPDNYIDRSITNRSSSAIIPDERYNTQNQPRDIRREPIHSENLTSKSLQMLREANKGQFSSLDEIDWDRPVYVKLFDEPSLGEYHPLEKKPDLVQWAWNEHARRMKLENEVAVRNDMIDLTKKGLGLIGSLVVKGATSAGALLSANLNLYSELAKYWNECSSGVRTAQTSDTFEILLNATKNTIVDVLTPWAGDDFGAAYGLGEIGTGGMRVFNSIQIGISLSDFAVKNEKQEE